MEQVIAPVDTQLIENELTVERFLRHTNKAGNEIYVVDAFNAPNTMREIGRLREITFRAAGGGTGKSCDIDEFDTMPKPCKQLIVWDPEERGIIGAYRFIVGTDVEVSDAGVPRIATGHMFKFSPKFISDYLPVTIELGRSWVRPDFQSSQAGAKALFALDNLWDGLGALTVEYPQVQYLFGKMTMYPSYPRDCRDMLLRFLALHFPDPESLVRPITPLSTGDAGGEHATCFTGTDFGEDYRRLKHFIREHGYNIPPLVNSYMSLSPHMHVFGTAVNHEFGEVEETGIFIKIDEITVQKKSRHIDTYHNDKRR